MGDRYRRDRGHDENVEYFGAGESYRPGGHSEHGHAAAAARFDDGPPRRPGPRRDRERNNFSPYKYSRGSTEPRRPSPRRAYSPPPPPRDFRPNIGGGGYLSRSRSPQALSGPLGPPRRRNGPADDCWRRPSPSPRNSNGPSRRSSPRAALDRVSSAPRSPAYSSRHDNDVGLAHDYRDHAPPPPSAAAPPSGPSRNSTYDRVYERGPPSGPSHPPTPTGPALSTHGGPPPSRPRGGGGGAYNAPPAARGRSSLVYRAPPAFPFRGSSNSTSRTYPMTQRFNNPSTSHTNSSTAGGGASAGATTATTTTTITPSASNTASATTTTNTATTPSNHEQKLKHLEAEAERMRAELREKQARVRDSLAEWDVRQRESAREALRSELAENNLRSLEADGDDAMDVAAF
ncbi:hypothetical protein DV738_g1626, partial [Chaetothyriales sp. CBS 135597]